ncbi:MAG: c-type cytochrome [Candidatus Brocadiae bacterium]|nr:c-type cytochrome [Candidatus Brocadiia bacterium]
MNRNKHLLLWASTGTLLVLLWAAYSEHVLSEWRQAQAHVAAHLPPGTEFEIQLRQIVVPALKATDRCVSCHVGMAPGETGIAGDRIYGKHPPVHHEPAEIGCTTCHAGQGRATTKAGAHGTAPHWPQPMIPLKHVQAGCGSCHSHVHVPNLAMLDRGRDLVDRYDCLSCHRIDGKGGTFRPGGAGGGEGPDLSAIGAKGIPGDWYEGHLGNRRLAEAGKPPDAFPWKASFGEIPERDRTVMEGYLSSRIGVPALAHGKSLFNSLGCRGCHKVNGVGGDDGPDLSRAGERDPALTNFSRVTGEHTIANWHAQHLKSPATIVPGSAMPDFGLTDAQVDSLVTYLLSLRRTDAPEALWPPDRARALRLGEREFSTDGSTLYATFCASCHGTSGEGMRFAGAQPFPAVGNRDFLAVATDDFLKQSILHGRPGRRMPAWGEKEGGLRPREIDAIVAYLRSTAGGIGPEKDTKPARWAKDEPGAGAQLFAAHCATCHGKDGEGAEGVALNNTAFLKAATDTYLFESIRRGRSGTTMPSFASGSPARQALSAGEIEAIVAFLRTWEVKK